MLAAIAGVTRGVAKNCLPVLYSFDFMNDRNWAIDALDAIYADFSDKLATSDGSSLSVLNLSWGYPAFTDLGWARKLSDILTKLVDIGMFPVTAAGNMPAVSNPFYDFRSD